MRGQAPLGGSCSGTQEHEDARSSCGHNADMKIYADTPARRTRQVISDIWFVVWVVLWIWLAVRLHDLIVPLGTPGEKLQAAGDSLAGNMTSAGDFVDGIPLIGDGVRTPFDKMSVAGQSIADAGATQQEVVDKLALFLPLTMAFLAISLLALMWLPSRVRFTMRATAARQFLNATDDVDLFALRALARQPLNQLVAIDPDPAGGWRRRDESIIRALAALELRSEGLRIPELTDRTGTADQR